MQDSPQAHRYSFVRPRLPCIRAACSGTRYRFALKSMDLLLWIYNVLLGDSLLVLQKQNLQPLIMLCLNGTSCEPV